ncbi:hypothetical protein DL96DRAFT_1646309 [Flagelloscypha sp. PMI_526]|nr:hypothetical protein DL96DRAFT_1646309 [Flagelloscypha sp. PMI_526]
MSLTEYGLEPRDACENLGGRDRALASWSARIKCHQLPRVQHSEVIYLWTVMEYVERGTLSDVVETIRLLRIRVGASVCRHAKGFSLIYSQETIHYLIKSNKVQLDAYEQVKITYFGFQVKLTITESQRTKD